MSVVDNKVVVPPYKFDAAIICWSLEHIFSKDNKVADCPEDTAKAPTPPSNKLIFSSKAATVGLLILVYI